MVSCIHVGHEGYGVNLDLEFFLILQTEHILSCYWL